MKPIYQFSNDLDAETIRGQLTTLVGQAAIMTNMLVNFDDWSQQQIEPFAKVIDRKVREIAALVAVIELDNRRVINHTVWYKENNN